MTQERFFRSYNLDDTVFFDEGQKKRHNVARVINNGTFANTSSITTVQIDAYRQGVELTQQKHFDAGTVKIHAGEPGHVVSQNGFGMSKNTLMTGSAFQDLDRFDPVSFIRAQKIPSLFDLSTAEILTVADFITLPVLTGEGNEGLDGVLEPLPIRDVASLNDIDVPARSRGFRASFMAGNEDIARASDQVETVHRFNPAFSPSPYLDLVNAADQKLSFSGYFYDTQPVLEPYVEGKFEAELYKNVSNPVKSVVTAMTGSTENHVNSLEKSSVSGWTYVNVQGIGTDSIAFGGLTH